MRQLQGCKAGTRQPQEVQGRYKATTKSAMWVGGNYKVCEAGIRQLQGL